MHCFHNRPLALACLLLVLSVIFVYPLSAAVKLFICIAAAALSIASLLLFVCKKCGRGSLLIFLCLFGIAIGVGSSYVYFNRRYEKYLHLVGKEIVAEGIVLSRGNSAVFYTSLEVSIDRIDGAAENVKAEIYLDHSTPLQAGDRFVLTGEVIDPATLLPEKTGEKTFLAEGNLLYLSVEGHENVEILQSKGTDFRVFFSKLNLRLSYALRNLIGGEEGGVAVALLLGNRTWISDRTMLDFRRAGISHLLALSGLHVSILVGFAEWVLRKIRLPKAVRGVCVLLLTLSYLALTGFSPSTLRAVLMCGVLYLAFFLSDQYDPLTALFLILALILTVTPYAAFDVSVWMSFLAAGSILIFSPAFDEAFTALREKSKLPVAVIRAIKAVGMALVVGIVANLGLMLYSALIFGEISFASVPATLVLSIPVALLLILTLILFVFPFLPLLPQTCSGLSRIIISTAGAFSDIENIVMPATGIETRVCLALLTAFLIFLAVSKLKSFKWIIPVPLLLALTVVVTQVATVSMQRAVPITVSAGRGEVRIYSTKGSTVVVNDTRGNASGAYEIKLSVTADYCTEIDDLVFCRYYNQANYFISRLASVVKVRSVHFPTPTDAREEAIARRLEQEAECFGIEVFYDAEYILAEVDTGNISS